MAKDLRAQRAPLPGRDPGHISPGRMTYDLRRPRLHDMMARALSTHRDRLTPQGLRSALFVARVHSRIMRPGLARIVPTAPLDDSCASLLLQTGARH